jgi:hypothetical protein
LEKEESEIILVTAIRIFSNIKSDTFISDRGFPSLGKANPTTRPSGVI